MIGQKTLYSFFSPTSTGKRSTRSPEPTPKGDVDAEDSVDAASPAKKARVGQDEPAKPPSSPLSEEQLVCIQRNRAAALLRLAAHNVPAGFGESWKQHLSGELGEAVLRQANGLCC
ncbi:hypothetical protein U0070_023229 [Myodes glareolus]|uniref:Uncharacterized protein n=1 Tax=Myodes glareolus TaxID=447135 RepID=A0AAW0HB00_MYOGA